MRDTDLRLRMGESTSETYTRLLLWAILNPDHISSKQSEQLWPIKWKGLNILGVYYMRRLTLERILLLQQSWPHSRRNEWVFFLLITRLSMSRLYVNLLNCYLEELEKLDR